MRKIGKFFKGLGYFLCILVTNIVVGIALIRFGIFPQIKSFWVTSTVTTLSHEYLARVVATEKEIQKIVASNRVEETTEAFDRNVINLSKQPGEEDNTDGEQIKNKDTIELTEISGEGYKGYMLSVSNPKKIRLVASKNFGSSGTKLNEMIQEYGGVGGINAGGFSDIDGHGTGGNPTGIILEDGQVIWKDNSTTFSIVGFDKEGILVLGNYTVKQIEELGIQHAVSFGPALIVNRKPTKIYGDGGWGINPRTVIGQKADGTVLMLVIDGRQVSSVGATIKEIQNIMMSYGAVNASNLDGGSSTVMYYQDKLINHPCSAYGERPLPNAFVITK